MARSGSGKSGLSSFSAAREEKVIRNSKEMMDPDSQGKEYINSTQDKHCINDAGRKQDRNADIKPGGENIILNKVKHNKGLIWANLEWIYVRSQQTPALKKARASVKAVFIKTSEL